MLQVNLLGPLAVRRDEHEVSLVSMKQRLLVSRLAVSFPRPVAIDALVDDLWGDRPPKAVLNSIQVAVSALRALLGSTAIETQGRSYSLGAGISVDAEHFRSELDRGNAAFMAGDLTAAKALIGRALSRWRDEPLADLDPLPFVRSARDTLTTIWLDGLEVWSAIAVREGRSPQVITRLASIVADHPLRETLRAQYIEALAAADRTSDALAEFESARRSLRDELGVDPGPALRRAQSAVLRDEVPATVLTTNAHLTLGLREPQRRIIGRERDLVNVTELISRPGVRLISVLGPGGIGKTRLLQEIVSTSAIDAALIELVSTDSADGVFETICNRLGIAAGVDAEANLVSALELHAGPLLIGLDNCEHLPEAVPLVERLLGRVHGLKIIATSRIALESKAEYRYPLAALATDGSHDSLSPAAELVFETIRSRDPLFQPTESDKVNARAISVDCAGFPLAIELVAARSMSNGLGELRSQLSEPLESIAPESDEETEGSTSLARTIHWSVASLSSLARRALLASATFRGGFDASALAAVAGVSRQSATELLHILREYGLVTASNSPSGRRFDVLNVISEIIAESYESEFSELATSHARYFVNLARPTDGGMTFPRSQAELRMVAHDAANFRVAVRTLGSSDERLCGELVDSLAVAWMRVGTPVELAQWINVLLAGDAIGNEVRLDLLIHLLRVQQTRANFDPSPIIHAAHQISGSEMDPGRRCTLASFEALIAADNLDEEAVQRCLDFAMHFPVNLDDEVLTYAQSLCRLALFTVRADEDSAAEELRGFLIWARSRGLELHALSATHNLMQSLLILGRHSEAADLALDQLGNANEFDVSARVATLHLYGAALIHLGNPALAVEILESVVLMAHQQGMSRPALYALAALSIARLKCDPADADAAAYVGIYKSWLDAAGLQLDGVELELFETYMVSPMKFASRSVQQRHLARGEALFTKLGTMATLAAIADSLAQHKRLLSAE
jgi:DNA-binding SARP family transcriptional activator/predicted ATPase